MTGHRVPRRALIQGGLAGLSAVLVGCGSNSESATAPPSAAVASAETALAAVEASFGGRLGVYAMDTGDGTAVRYRADERFLMCSTHKVLVVSAILRSRGREPGLLGRLVRYDQSQVLEYAPVTSEHVADGMTVSALCEAAITLSDNTAVNLLLQVLGGPPAVTAFVRTLGDPITRLDRTEPELNVGAPGDQRDTSTPAQMAADLRTLVLGEGLDQAGRDLLAGWLRANTTGGKLIRAGLPVGWVVGDKTGSGSHGEVNDIAVVWPPHHSPLVMAVYAAPVDPKSRTGQATVATAATTVATALAPTV